MNENSAFVVALALLIGGTIVSRRYLSRNGQILLGVIVTLAHLA